MTKESIEDKEQRNRHQKQMIIKEHINYNNGSVISNYSKTDIKYKQTSFDVSEVLNDERVSIQNISALGKNMKDGRNIVVPKVQKQSKKYIAKGGWHLIVY